MVVLLDRRSCCRSLWWSEFFLTRINPLGALIWLSFVQSVARQFLCGCAAMASMGLAASLMTIASALRGFAATLDALAARGGVGAAETEGGEHPSGQGHSQASPPQATGQSIVFFTKNRMDAREGCYHTDADCEGLTNRQTQLLGGTIHKAKEYGLRPCCYCVPPSAEHRKTEARPRNSRY